MLYHKVHALGKCVYYKVQVCYRNGSGMSSSVVAKLLVINKEERELMFNVSSVIPFASHSLSMKLRRAMQLGDESSCLCPYVLAIVCTKFIMNLHN